MPRHLTVQDLYTYGNGLTLNGATVQVGGSLTQATTINRSTFDFNILDASSNGLIIANWGNSLASGNSTVEMYPQGLNLYAKHADATIYLTADHPTHQGEATFMLTQNTTYDGVYIESRINNGATGKYSEYRQYIDSISFQLYDNTRVNYFTISGPSSSWFQIVDNVVTVNSLKGTGTRMVVADASGNLSTQAISSGGAASKFGVVGEDTTATANRTFDGAGVYGFTFNDMGAVSIESLGTNKYTYFENGGGYGDWFAQSTTSNKLVGLAFNSEGATPKVELYTTGTKLILNAATEKIQLQSTNGVVVSTLAGTGTRMVVADANGLLSTQSVAKAYSPTSTADATGATGDVAYDDNYVYVKTSIGWKRSALSTF